MNECKPISLHPLNPESSYIFQINGCTMIWYNKKQSCVPRSTTEDEYKALNFATQEAILLRRLLENQVCVKQKESAVIYEDNQGAIQLSRNPKFHNRTKHINIAFHFVSGKVQDKYICVKYCKTDEMLADISTKRSSKTNI